MSLDARFDAQWQAVSFLGWHDIGVDPAGCDGAEPIAIELAVAIPEADAQVVAAIRAAAGGRTVDDVIVVNLEEEKEIFLPYPQGVMYFQILGAISAAHALSAIGIKTPVIGIAVHLDGRLQRPGVEMGMGCLDISRRRRQEEGSLPVVHHRRHDGDPVEQLLLLLRTQIALQALDILVTQPRQYQQAQ